MEQIMFQKYLPFLLLAIWRWNSDWGNSIFVSTFCGAWLNKVKVDWFLFGLKKMFTPYTGTRLSLANEKR
jgi:hypothetical protein